MLSTTVKPGVLHMCNIKLIHSSSFRRRYFNCPHLSIITSPQRALHVPYFQGGDRCLINYGEFRGVTAMACAAARCDRVPSPLQAAGPAACLGSPSTLSGCTQWVLLRLSAWQRASCLDRLGSLASLRGGEDTKPHSISILAFGRRLNRPNGPFLCRVSQEMPAVLR